MEHLTFFQGWQVLSSLIILVYLIIIHRKTKTIMAQNDQLLAILTSENTSIAKIAGDLQKIIDDAGDQIPADTLTGLQAAADNLKTTADAIDAAVNPAPPPPATGE